MSRFLDDLARNLATSMPRSRALRILGGAVVTVAVPMARPGLQAASARGWHPAGCGAPGTCTPSQGTVCGCDFLAGCYRDCCPAGFTCCKWPSTGIGGPPCEKNCCPPGTVCGSGRPGDVCVTRCDVPCGGDCCKKGEFCANFRQKLCCKKGETGCGNRCCATNEECVSIRTGSSSERVCVARCPQGRARCGESKCCPTNWRCANPSTGLCKRCGTGEEECERKCCNRQTTRCCGKAGCCPKSRSCCVTGDKQTCCPAGQKCAVPILAGDIGVKAGTASICCPPARYHESPKLCCPPGQVALRGQGQQVGPGLSPYCCPSGQLCGSTCCQKSSVLGSQTCCGGKCVDTQFDPQNCGRCGNVCDSGTCGKGVCAFA